MVWHQLDHCISSCAAQGLKNTCLCGAEEINKRPGEDCLVNPSSPRQIPPPLPHPLCAEEVNKRPDEYWTLVMDIARKNNLKRIVRCSQVMGRAETDELSAAQIFYPCMQAADIFFLKVRRAPVAICGL